MEDFMRKGQNKALFVTFEGIEGSGKTTAMNLLGKKLEEEGMAPLMTREPGGSSLGQPLRSMLLDPSLQNIDQKAELFLFLADRCQHIAEVIVPALESGLPVLCDRFIDSTLAYQGYGRGMDVEEIRTLNAFAQGNLMPDLTFLFDLPVWDGIERASKRNQNSGDLGKEARFDEESLEFHERVRNGYLDIARGDSGRIVVIDASRPLAKVVMDCYETYIKTAKGVFNAGDI